MTLTTPIPFRFADVPFELEPAEGGGFVARNAALQITVIGDSPDQATASFRQGVRDLLEICVEHRLPLPSELAPLLQLA